jgi:tRNA(adenine34) deaminase
MTIGELDDHFMAMALREAEKASKDGEVPTGCVIVEIPEGEVSMPAECRILGRAHNQTEGLVDATAHAEMLALSQAFAAKGNWRLTGCRLYVTKEPCPMCAGAIVLGRLDAVVWGASDPKRGGSTVFDIFRHPGINHHPELVPGVKEDACLAVLKDFFRTRRQQNA